MSPEASSHDRFQATLRNTSIVFAVLFSRVIGERPGPRQWAGAALITAGAMGLAWPR